MMKKQYKFLRAGLKSNKNGFQWEIGKWYKTEYVELCHGFNCSNRIVDALRYVQGEILAEVETRGKYLKIVKAYRWEKEDSVALAIFAAELVIDIYEKQYPTDYRPRRNIQIAKDYLANPKGAVMTTAMEAMNAAIEAGEVAGEKAATAAGAAAWAARKAGQEAASEAAMAASVAVGAASEAAGAAEAEWAAIKAASRASEKSLDKIEAWLLQHIEMLTKYPG